MSLFEAENISSPSEDFWYQKVLGLNVSNGHMTDSWENWGYIRWEIVGCLALCWCIVCLSLIKGTRVFGKISYVTTIFPYIILTVMLGYIATLEGFSKGMDLYLNPNWEKLTDYHVWKKAAAQIFFELSVGIGGQLTFASYNGFKNNCHRG